MLFYVDKVRARIRTLPAMHGVYDASARASASTNGVHCYSMWTKYVHTSINLLQCMASMIFDA